MAHAVETDLMGLLRGTPGAVEKRARRNRRSFPIRISKELLPRKRAKVQHRGACLPSARTESAASGLPAPGGGSTSPGRGQNPHVTTVYDHKQLSRAPPR